MIVIVYKQECKGINLDCFTFTQHREWPFHIHYISAKLSYHLVNITTV
jgi:hypothetical protein